MPYQPTPGVLSWADNLDDKTLAQITNSTALPFVERPVALMADAHLGYGVPVGTVLATRGAIIPSAVGVDIGCGMVAARLNVGANELDLDRLHSRITEVIPAGQPRKGRRGAGSFACADRIVPLNDDMLSLLGEVNQHVDEYSSERIASQFGTLGGGNHFTEVSEDEDGRAWLVLHSGSRGVGKHIADLHIARAKGLMKQYFIELDDPNLAYLVEDTSEFDRYISAMLWAQRYAAASRALMMAAALAVVAEQIGHEVADGDMINCHHNYTTREHHRGKNLWVTRKGAINAEPGALGIIPGSMATGSYIVEGLGDAASFNSASHGAGRTLSRTAARKTLTESSLNDAMDGVAWNNDSRGLLDEHPAAYKDIDAVMAAQATLVKPLHRLRTVLNYKGS